MVKFDLKAVQRILKAGEKVKITISGALKDGRMFSGDDFIRVTSPPVTPPSKFVWKINTGAHVT